jgi:Uma2 family endonuclease
MSSFDATHLESELPDLDDRLVVPGTRYEMLDGELVYVPPADAPHASRHSKVSALVEVHAGAEFIVACDMLTRTSKVDDIAPDVSVYPRAPHPRTGRRQLQHMAFEVVSKGLRGYVTKKSAKLSARGVRRVFVIDLKRERALEWSRAHRQWTVLDTTGVIEDPALAVALPIAALLSAARADDAIARALLAKRNPVLEKARAQDRAQGRARGRAEGHVRGAAEALLVVLAARGIEATAADRVRILVEQDPARLSRWIERAATCTRIAEVFTDS